MAWNLGTLIIKNDSGGPLVVQGVAWANGVQFDLMDGAVTDEHLVFKSYNTACCAWTHTGNWLGDLNAAGLLSLVSISMPDISTWIGPPPY